MGHREEPPEVGEGRRSLVGDQRGLLDGQAIDDLASRRGAPPVAERAREELIAAGAPP